MAHSHSNHDLRRRPRKGWRPSERNLAMHQAYRSGLRTQVELAEEFGLTHAEMPPRFSRGNVGRSGGNVGHKPTNGWHSCRAY
jgi:hypothetical protein